MEVIERPRHQDRVEGVRRKRGEVECVAVDGAGRRDAHLGRLLDGEVKTALGEVNECDGVAALRESDGVAAGAATDVEDRSGWRREMIDQCP